MNTLSLSFSTSPFVCEKFYEIIDWKMVIKMLLSDKVLRTTKIKRQFGETCEYENERKQFVELLKSGCKFSKSKKEIETAYINNTLSSVLPKLYHHTERYLVDKLEVKYFYDKKKAIGRVYPSHSLSLCSFRRNIRHVLAEQKYIDLDIVNCHFKIADELFNKENILFPMLHDYVMRRDRYLQMLCNYFNDLKAMEYIGQKPLNIVDDYDLLKQCFLIQLYYGTWAGWCSDNGLPPLETPDFIVALKKEFEELAELIKTNNPEMVSITKCGAKYDNVNGSIVSWYLQEWERRILEIIKNTLKKEKQISKNGCVLCFDGIMIELNNKNCEKAIQDKLFKTVKDAISKELKISIDLKVKAFDELEYKEVLESVEVEEFEDTMVLIDDKDDKEAGSIIYDRLLKDKLFYCNSCYYLKTNNKWICDFKSVLNQLLQLILESNIYTTTAKGELKCYCQSVNHARDVREAILSYVSTIPNDKLYNKFHDTTTGKICFEDGVLFLKEKQFILWEDEYFNNEKNEIYTTIIVDRKFKNVFDNRENENWINIKNNVKNDLFYKILGEQTNKMLQQLSRAIGGFFIDKDWALWIGERNCGKGCINELLMTAFEKYIYNLPSNCLLHSKFANKDTKENSWMIDLQYPRITLVQEFKKDTENQNNIRVDGVAIKSIISGGDPQLARKNYQDEISFRIGTKIVIMCNDFPKIDPQDCLETCIQYNSGKKFKSAEYIALRKKELEEQVKEITDIEKKNSILSELDTYLEADDEMKYKCKSLEWGDAFVLLLLDNFVDKKLEPSNDSDLKESNNDEDVINDKILFTKNKDDKLTNENIRKIFHELGLKISFQKFKNILVSRGCCEYRTNGFRGLYGLKEILSKDVDV